MAFTGYSSNIYNSCVQISKIIITTPRIPDIADVQYFCTMLAEMLFMLFLISVPHVLYVLQQAVDKRVYCYFPVKDSVGQIQDGI